MDGPALLEAAEAGDTAVVRALLDEGADVNEANSHGDTALMRAAAHGHLETVRLLLDEGADANAQRGDGMTPLIRAAFFGHAGVVSALLDGGAAPGVRDRIGMTARDWARSKGEMEVFNLLNGFRVSHAHAPPVRREHEATGAAEVFASAPPAPAAVQDESPDGILDLPDARGAETTELDPHALPRAASPPALEPGAEPGVSAEVEHANFQHAAPTESPSAPARRADEDQIAPPADQTARAPETVGEDFDEFEVTQISVAGASRVWPDEHAGAESDARVEAPAASSEGALESGLLNQPMSWPRLVGLSLALMVCSAALTWVVIWLLDGVGFDPEPSPPASQSERVAPQTAAADGARASNAPRPTDRPATDDAVLAGALNDWVAATNARDVERQMSFYAPRLDVFYRRRDVTGRAVRREKASLYGRARAVSVSASAPEIKYGPDALTATMRFRKAYSIESPRRARRGEVVQELVWRKTEDGWKIVGERDVQVIR